MYPIDLLSYNLNYHAAYPELQRPTQLHAPDILCLQECSTDNLASDLAGLTLAAKTTTGTLGLAIYCDSRRFLIQRSMSIPVLPSQFEKIRVEARERLLIVELFDVFTQQALFVASFHATHLIATNRLRRLQLTAALKVLNTLHNGSPVILAGDFNYPFFHHKLKRTAQKYNYDLLTTNNPTFYERKFSGRFDMATVSGMQTHHIRVLPFGVSDHAPILMRLSS